ncbi:MAG: PAS domain S-box protein [Nitrospirae bacterium YQR-1]
MEGPDKKDMKPLQSYTTAQTVKFFEKLLNSSSDGIVITDPGKNIIFINNTFCSFFNCLRKDMLETNLYSWLQRFNVKPQDAYIQIENQVLREGVSTNQDVSIITNSGERFFCINSSILEQVAGEDAGVITSIWRDVTECKMLERAALEKKQQLHTAFEFSTIGIAITSPSKGWLDANNKLCEMLGYSKEELIKMTWEEITFPEDLQPDLALFSRVLNGQMDGYKIQKRFIRKDGTIIHTMSWINCRRAQDGLIQYCVVLIEDITERLTIEQRYKTILQTSIDGFWVVDTEGKLIQVNTAYCNMTGYTQQELLKMTIRNVEVIESPEDTRRRIEKIMETGGDRFESRHRCKDGKIIDVEISVNYIKNDNIMFAFVRDITGRKAMEEAIMTMNLNLHRKVEEEIAKNRSMDQLMYEQSRHVAMGELLVNIAHQWRQPLTTIGLLIQDIGDAFKYNELSDEYLEKNITTVMSELDGLSNTINDFKDFYMSNQQAEELKIKEMINNALAVTSGYFDMEDIVIEKELDDDLTINAVQSEFAQVIMNMLTNVRDVWQQRQTPERIVKIHTYKEPATNKIIITIADNGGGVPEDIIGKIFDPYFTTKDKSCGTGLGLYVTKLLVEKSMKGTITVRNIDGWCEFRIEI